MTSEREETADRIRFDPCAAAATAAWEAADLHFVEPGADQPPYDGPVRTYVIAAAPRAGAMLLCHLLAATGRMGVPAGYLGRRAAMPVLAGRWGILGPRGVPVGEFFRRLVRLRTTPNGVMGLKLHFHQLEEFLPRSAVARFASVARHVWLRRRDPVAQAISFAIALRTQRFHAAKDDPEGDDDAPFSMAETIDAARMCAMADAAWRSYFLANAITPLEVWYEDLVADPDVVCRAIAGMVGVTLDRPVSDAAIPLRRQSPDRYDRWRRALMGELRLDAPLRAA
ncbi:MAG: Stf0 family sulfotransferase [Alphaproteobacteria bacterium]